MIKLFWNTHNQNKPNSNETNTTVARNYIWGLYHKNNSDKWIYEVLDKIQFKIVQNEKDLESDDILIIIDSNIEKKVELYTKLQIICRKVFLIHLGCISLIFSSPFSAQTQVTIFLSAQDSCLDKANNFYFGLINGTVFSIRFFER